MDNLKKVFGISSISYAVETEKDIEAIKKVAGTLADNWKNNVSFRVIAKRADKRFPLISPEIEQTVGVHVAEEKGLGQYAGRIQKGGRRRAQKEAEGLIGGIGWARYQAPCPPPFEEGRRPGRSQAI